MTNFARRPLGGAFAVLAALALAACGDDEAGGDLGPDPATLAPAGAPLYVEAVVRPEGDQKKGIEEALSRLLNTDDVGGEIRGAIDEGLQSEDAELSYGEDVGPWLGQRVGLFVSDFSEDGQGALIAATTDEDAASDALDKLAEASDSKLSEQTYEGVTYRVDKRDDGAAGIVDGFLVAGSEEGFRAAVDASAGESLADDADAEQARADVPGDHFFSLLVDVPGLVDSIESSGGLSRQQVEQLRSQLDGVSEGTAVAWGTADADAIAIEFAGPAGAEASEPTEIIDTLPGDAWFAFGAGPVGEQLTSAVESFETGLGQLPGGSVPEGIRGQIERETGLDLERDLGWIGETGAFVQGTSLLGIGGGLVLEATDEDAAAKALGKLRGALEKQREVEVTPAEGEGFDVQLVGAPVKLEVRLEGGRVVMAAGSVSAAELASPESTLADSERYGTASEALGEELQPAFFLDITAVVALLESTGQATQDPGYQQAKPILDALDYLIAGGAVDGDRARGGLVLGLREGGGEAGAAAVLAP